MTKAKTVPQTIKDTSMDPTVAEILDRSSDIMPIVDKVIGFWDYDLFSRKPSPAYTEDGVFQGTDLDLAAFLFALKNRGAVINIPTYASMRGTKVTEGVSVVSKENRHGQVVGLVANKETFNFSIRIKDMNVITSDSVGDYRTFTLTDFDGSWYDGWKRIDFKPDAKENDFIVKSGILSGNHISFKNFIHPNRWVSMYGKYYFITKLLIDRLTDESAYYNTVLKAMEADGCVKKTEPYPQTTAVAETKSIQVKAFEAIVDFIDNTTTFPKYEHTQENFDMLYERRKKLVYTIKPILMFMVRATECAFINHVNEKGLNSFPSWLKDVKWEEDYTPKGKRTKWNRLVFFQPGVGKTGVSLRFRVWEKSERVNENYAG